MAKSCRKLLTGKARGRTCSVKGIHLLQQLPNPLGPSFGRHNTFCVKPAPTPAHHPGPISLARPVVLIPDSPSSFEFHREAAERSEAEEKKKLNSASLCLFYRRGFHVLVSGGEKYVYQNKTKQNLAGRELWLRLRGKGMSQFQKK